MSRIAVDGGDSEEILENDGEKFDATLLPPG